MWEPFDVKAATSSFKGDGTEKFSELILLSRAVKKQRAPPAD